MGRLDAIVDDATEQEFRIEVIKRFGGRRGDISKGLEEAMQLWTKRDVIERLKQATLEEDSYYLRSDYVRTMKEHGKASIPALTELLSSKKLSYSEKSEINRTIRELTKERRSYSVFDFTF